MGHANLRNLSTFFLDQLNEHGKMSVARCTELAVEAGLYVSASEGRYYEDYMIATSLMEVVDHLWNYPGSRGGPAIETCALSEDQVEILQEWEEEGEPDDEEKLANLDAIEWRFTEAWRDRWREIEPLSHVTR
jgi:hypothetical protein